MKLEKVVGVVQNLSISNEYEDFAFNETDKNACGTVAVGAAAIGEIFSSTILNSGSAGAEIRMAFFSCTVDGMRIVGKFHEVAFSNGDCVEFVVEQEGVCLIAHAARSESQRILWMRPYASRGHIAQKRSDIKWSLIFATIAVLFTLALDTWKFDPDPNAPWYYFAILHGGMFAGALIINLWARSRMYGFSEVATEVLLTFGYSSPESVDLNLIHKKAEKQLHQETGILPPLTKAWCFRY